MRFNTVSRLIRLATLVSIVAIAPRAAFGECALPGPICDAFAQAATVALVDVTEVTPSHEVHLRVIELFKGDATAEIVFVGGGMHDFDYVAGQRLLVYLLLGRNGLESTCTRTKPAAGTDFEVAAVRALRDRRSGSWTYGALWAPVKEGFNFRPDAVGVPVTLRQRNRVIARVKTDRWGRFELGWLAPGRYAVDVRDSPFGRGTTQDIEVTGTSNCLSLPPIEIPPK